MIETGRRGRLMGSASCAALAAVAAGLSFPQAAMADPDPCTADGATLTCSGDQSGGVSRIDTATTTIDLKQLTKAVAPPPGQSVVDFENVANAGLDAPLLTLSVDATLDGATRDAGGLVVISSGGTGLNGADGSFLSNGDDGTAGRSGGGVVITNSGAIAVGGDKASAIEAEAGGGRGGVGGDASGLGHGGTGGRGGASGTVTVSNGGALSADGSDGHGIFAYAVGGEGNVGGSSGVLNGSGPANGGGDADAVTVTNSGAITTGGVNGSAIFARSLGGRGSSGTTGGDNGAFGGRAGTVTIDQSGALTTAGDTAFGIFADSIGGFGGDGQSVSGAIVHGGNGGSGSGAGSVRVSDAGSITTGGAGAYGIYARSLGGTAGSGGAGKGAVSNGGSGGRGGNAGGVSVEVAATGSVTTQAIGASGVYAESVGGMGGRGGDAFGAVGDAAGGGAGGNGGTIDVTIDGKVTTMGNDAYGVLAVSRGAPGGFGGTGAGVVAFGGYGGGGSKGGAVTVVNNGTVSTFGEVSLGIAALSVGGGGGVGGLAGGLVSFGGGGPDTPPGCYGGGSAVDRTLCNDGGVVAVTNNGTVTTRGKFAAAITAASIGGGGGDGNEAVGAFSFGGSGGEGGDGGTVTVTNSNTGSLLTSGDFARGISASSIGGGGGYGGGALAIGVSTQVAVGGSGGNGGDGGAVEVANAGTITALGMESDAIFAESVGGGGGDGGAAQAAGLSAFTLALGGSGGGGGNGGTVTVANTGVLKITNDKSDGIFAQSVGGGGGNGGAATTFGASPVVNIAVSLGGSGGDGGSGSAVAVSNSGGIITDGEDDVAIFAQSVGGGGGTGGAALAQSIAISGGDIPAVSLAFSMGGSGGKGGDGGTVDVANSGTIRTFGDLSYAIHAQSVGGGGGAGGDAAALGTAMAFGGGSLKLTVSLGGSGGDGGKGDSVAITNLGSINTQGMASYGLFAQSVGGGGGSGGVGGASKPMLEKIGTALGKYIAKKGMGKSAASSTSKNLQLNFSFGGSGGVAGDGGAVTIDNRGSVVTQGYNAFGIFGQSVGGGGGAGGGGLSQAGGLVTNKAALTSTLKASVALGGNSGAFGNGGAVSITNEGSVLTYGGDATAIFAESIGGGGGVVDTGADDDDEPVDGEGGSASGGGKLASFNFLTFNVGGNGGAGGNGGTVTVNQTGNVATLGSSSFGIEAQSIGGGGGQGGDASNGYLGLLTLGGQGGAAGNGGDVNVTMDGDIVTAGNGSRAIFAQSVGGGGGVAGDIAGNAKTLDLQSLADTFSVDLSSVSDTDAPASADVTNVSFTLPSFVGLITETQSGGGGGTGGAVRVVDTGNITTYGTGADGIFAQSVGGGGGVTGTSSLSVLSFIGSNGDSGSGGTVTVDHTGNISVNGSDASAIFAQSVGGSVSVKAATRFAVYGQAFVSQNEGSFAKGDNITINVAGGTFQGGSGKGVGIRIDGGLVNTVTIADDATVEALSGVAMLATVNSGLAITSVDNAGTVIGDVFLAGTPLNSFANESGALLEPNARVNLTGGALINRGTLSPGGSGTAAAVEIDGTLNETAGSTYVADIGYGLGPSDQLLVVGDATIGGTIVPEFSAITNQPVTLVTTTGTITDAGATTVGNTPVLTFGLAYSSQALALVTQADWTPAAAHLDSNEFGVGAHLQAIWDAGGSQTLAGVMGQLARLPTYDGYADALSHLSPGPYLAAIGALDSGTRDFTDNLMSCHSANGARAPIDEEDCAWGIVQPGTARQSASSRSLGYHGHGVGLQLGAQRHIGDHWVLGGSLGYASWQRKVTNLARLDGDDFTVGAVAKYGQGAWSGALALTVDYGSFDAVRQLTVPTSKTVSAKSNLLFLGLRGRLAYLVKAKALYLKPYADVNLGYYHMGGFAEKGGDIVGLDVDRLGETRASFAPMLEVGTIQPIGGTYVLRPFIAGGVSVSTRKNWSIAARFQGGPPDIDDMSVDQGAHDALEQLVAGVALASGGRFALRVQYDGRFASHYSENSEMLKLAMAF